MNLFVSSDRSSCSSLDADSSTQSNSMPHKIWIVQIIKLEVEVANHLLGLQLLVDISTESAEYKEN